MNTIKPKIVQESCKNRYEASTFDQKFVDYYDTLMNTHTLKNIFISCFFAHKQAVPLNFYQSLFGTFFNEKKAFLFLCRSLYRVYIYLENH